MAQWLSLYRLVTCTIRLKAGQRPPKPPETGQYRHRVHMLVNIKTIKVGDKVISTQHDYPYHGVVSAIESEQIYVDRKGYCGWECKVMSNGRIATASGCWDEKSLLHYLNRNELIRFLIDK